jgi:amino acid transporter
VALVYGALSVRVPLSGYSYQWASRLANPHVGWWFGWMSFAFLTIVTVSVDYGLVQVAFQPLIGQAYTPTSAALETLVVLALQAALIITSTRITTRVNNTAVATEIIGIVGLTVLLLIVAAVRSLGHWSNLGATGAVPHAGYFNWLGPFMLATLLGAYTIVGFESASNLAEETHEPHKVIPRAMVRAVLLSGIVGFAFLIVVAYATNKAAYDSSAPVASIVHDVLGGVVQKIFLVFVCVSIFACGLVIMITNSRLIFSMARDRRLPGHQFLHQVPRATGGPPWATILAAVLSGAIALVLRTHTGALTTLFTASTIMPALLYAGTVLLYVLTSRRRGPGWSAHARPFGRYEIPVVAGAVIWLVYELIILIGPNEFRDAQYYVLGALGVGLVFYTVQLVTEPRAMRQEPGQE